MKGCELIMVGKYEEVSKEYRELRDCTGMGRGTFCKHFGIPVRTWQDWENGVRKPPSYIGLMVKKIIKYEKLDINKKITD